MILWLIRHTRREKRQSRTDRPKITKGKHEIWQKARVVSGVFRSTAYLMLAGK